MKFSNRRSLQRALDELGLPTVIGDQRAPVRVRVSDDGLVHFIWARCLPAGVDFRSLPVQWRTSADLMASDVVCAACEPDVISDLLPHTLTQALRIRADALAAKRVAANGTTVAGRVAKLDRALQAHLLELGRAEAPTPLTAQVDANLRELVTGARDALRAAGTSDAGRAQLLARIRTALLVDPTLRVRLPEDEHLIAVTPAVRGHGVIAELVAAFTVPDATHMVLRAPRYVADYLYREMHRSGDQAFIQTVPVAGLSADQISAAVRLWDPVGDNAMADLAVAVAAAGDIVHTPGPLPPTAG